MPSIVLPSDFASGLYRIPNAVSGNAGEGANADLQDVIDRAEKEMLLRALGKSQYDAFIVGGSEPWTSLATFVKPILIPYIYCQWLRYDEVNYTTVGGGKGQAQGQAAADLNAKYVEAWNEFVRLYCDGEDFETDLYEYLTATDGLSEAEFQFAYDYQNQFGL